MTPDSIHLLCQLVRHSRAIVTSFEKWVQKQPPSPACRELLQILAVYRGVLTQVEDQLSKFDADAEAKAS